MPTNPQLWLRRMVLIWVPGGLACPPGTGTSASKALGGSLLGDDALVDGRPGVASLIARDDATLRIAIGIEREGADDGVEPARAHDRLEDGPAVVRPGLRESREDDLAGSVAVRGVEGRIGPAVRRLVCGRPRLACC